jgi:hypothetical protein
VLDFQIKNNSSKTDYPVLKISKDGLLIVLFTQPDTGVLLLTSGGTDSLLYQILAWKESRFKLFDDELVIKNAKRGINDGE